MINTIFRDNIRPTATTKRQLPYEDKLGDAEKWNMIFPRLIGLLTRFFSYPWFWRVWVVQEAWLSRKAVVHCGDERVSWEAGMLANYWMVDTVGGGLPGIVQESLPSLWTRIARHQNIVSSVNDVKAPGGTTNSRMKILDLVLEGAELNTTDPRDRIFALLGLTRKDMARSALPFEPASRPPILRLPVLVPPTARFGG